MKTLYHTLKAILVIIIVSLSGLQSAYARPIQIPLSIAYGVEPNVMIMLDNSGSMARTITLPDGTTPRKIDVAQNALTAVLDDTDNVRFCLSMFSAPSEGAFMDPTMQCTGDRTEIDAMVATINATDSPNTWTPLAEAFYDNTRYFRGLPAYFGRFTNSSGNTTSYNSPIQYRCQSNTVIVVTDGEPTRDWDNNGNAPNTSINLTGENMDGKSLPNWDGIPPSTPASATRNTDPLPHYSDGYCGMTGANNTNTCYSSTGSAIGRSNESRTVFLDDLALFGIEKDMRSGGTDAAGGGWDDPDYNNGLQSLKTHTIGFGFGLNNSPLVLADAAEYGEGSAFEANDEEGLISALKSAILTAAGGAGAGAGTAQSAFRFDDNGELNLYLTDFDSELWSGDLMKIVVRQSVDEDLEEASFTATLEWRAAEHLDTTKPPSTRNIFTYDPVADNIIDFTFADLPDTSVFGENTTPVFEGKSMAELKIEYLRGEQDYEKLVVDPAVQPPLPVQPEELFRARKTPLGDLVNSRPTFVKSFNFGYIDASYGAYLATQRNRNAMIYVGANDGMLHAFEDEGGSVNEKFAFIPSTVINSIPELAEDSFNANHQYYVDGKMTVVDAKLDGQWATVLGTPLGRGAKGLFLLDITDPNTGNDADFFRWEINENTLDSATVPVFSKMGYMLNAPKIARFQIPDGSAGGFHDKWVMIVGNGVHSEDAEDNGVIGKASVYVIDLDTGELITEILLDNGYENQNDSNGLPAYEKLAEGNGITSVAAVDVSQNSYVERLYAADLKGGIWRIDYDYEQSDNPTNDNTYLANNLASAYNTGGNPAPIFKAEGPVRSSINDTSPSGPDIAQPITAELAVTGAPEAFEDPETLMLFFGTGQYFDLPHVLETANLKVQSMYGIVDTGGWDTGRNILDKSNDLIGQGINESGDERFIDNNAINYTGDTTGDLGWFIDLPSYGERILLKPSAFFGYMSFFSQLPEGADVCALGSEGWAMFAKIDDATTIEDETTGNPRPLGVKTDNPELVSVIEDDTGNVGLLVPDPPDRDAATGSDVTLSSPGDPIPKRYSRAGWLRVQ